MKGQTSRKPRNPNFRHRSASRERQPYWHSSSEKEDSPQHRSGSWRSRRNFRCKNVSTTTQDARTYLNVHINGRPARLQLDTGADITMISRRTWKAIGSPTVERAKVPAKAANGSEMEILGRFEADFLEFLDVSKLSTIDIDDLLLDMEIATSPNPPTFWNSNGASRCPTIAS
ncbi:unnamed protein product [Heligmosomoides polygyrus]|uniref:Peptidase A2 domain-containing protein n=1 Tax=Heligmosomoides polygyrus TaxID=6339 RepID=A0A183GJS4_HELPZ|nr:unnamed protein product [Heligmosomoides polygyrus]